MRRFSRRDLEDPEGLCRLSQLALTAARVAAANACAARAAGDAAAAAMYDEQAQWRRVCAARLRQLAAPPSASVPPLEPPRADRPRRVVARFTTASRG